MVIETLTSLKSLDYDNYEYSAVIRTSKGDIELFLLPDASPQTVNNFATLARYHYYDGLPITKIVPRGWAEIDDPVGADGGRGPGYRLPNEADARGTVSSPNTGLVWRITRSPRAVRRAARMRVRSDSPRRTDPAIAGIVPAMAWTAVVLPTPLRPSRATISPGATRTSSPCTTRDPA